MRNSFLRRISSREVPGLFVLPVLFPNVLSLLARALQITCQLYADKLRLAVFANQRIDHLAQFGQTAANDRICAIRAPPVGPGAESLEVPGAAYSPYASFFAVAKRMPFSIRGNSFRIASRDSDA